MYMYIYVCMYIYITYMYVQYPINPYKGLQHAHKGVSTFKTSRPGPPHTLKPKPQALNPKP